MQLSQEEGQFYRQLFKVLSDPAINDLFVKFAQMKYNNAINKVRTKLDPYDYGYQNGAADTWQQVSNIKNTVTEILKNVG